ncbi:MAG: HEAT repeat domain-containing protein [Microcystaceae cyanobacterium]
MTTLQATTEGDLKALIVAVDQADSSEKLVLAVRNLAQTRDPEAIPTLITVLRYNNPGAAVAAVDGLVAIGQRVIPTLLENIDGYNYGARAWATRVFAGIGDVRALEILLDAATNDFALSVRRAAAQGLGNLQWQDIPPVQAKADQQRVLETLVQVATDREWIVRYAAIAGLQALVAQSNWKAPILAHLKTFQQTETEGIVQSRIAWALQQLD